jgi:hypothetical protein
MPLYNPVPQATTTTAGIVQLTNDLGGTYDSPTVRNETIRIYMQQNFS